MRVTVGARMAVGIGMGMGLATKLSIGRLAIGRAVQVAIGVTMERDLDGPVGFDGHGELLVRSGQRPNRSGWKAANAAPGKRPLGA
jgi:hypothetical protein